MACLKRKTGCYLQRLIAINVAADCTKDYCNCLIKFNLGNWAVIFITNKNSVSSEGCHFALLLSWFTSWCYHLLNTIYLFLRCLYISWNISILIFSQETNNEAKQSSTQTQILTWHREGIWRNAGWVTAGRLTQAPSQYFYIHLI